MEGRGFCDCNQLNTSQNAPFWTGEERTKKYTTLLAVIYEQTLKHSGSIMIIISK